MKLDRPPRVRTGVDRVLAGGADHLRGTACGLIVHPASVTSDLTFSADALLAAGFDVRALFGPQHGARGEKQDNMIESDYYADPVADLPVHSLYGVVAKIAQTPPATISQAAPPLETSRAY